MESVLIGALVGAATGGLAGLLAALALHLLKGLRNRIMERRGVGRFKDMILGRFHLPGGLLGGLLGAAIGPLFGLRWAAVAAALPAAVLAVMAIPATLWVAFTASAIAIDDEPPG